MSIQNKKRVHFTFALFLAGVIIAGVSGCLIIDIKSISGGGDPPAVIDLEHYRWRHNDGTEITATFDALEDTATTSVALGTVIRLRVLLHNTGTAILRNVNYQVQYGSNSNCVDGSWTPVPVAGSCASHPFCMYDTQLTDLDATTDVANGLTNPGSATFVAGDQVENLSNHTGNVTLDGDPYQFTEIEYGLQVTSNASAETTYYLRIYESDESAPLDVHSVCPQLVTAAGPAYTCNVETDAAAFGTINKDGVYTATTWTTTTMSAGQVIYLQIKSTGNAGNPGLWSAGQSYLIGSADADFENSTTIDKGDESYGIQAATTTAGTDDFLNLSFRYGTSNQPVDADCSDHSCYIGGLDTSDVTLASTTSGTTNNREVEVKYVASAAVTTKAGDYTDTVIYTCGP